LSTVSSHYTQLSFFFLYGRYIISGLESVSGPFVTMPTAIHISPFAKPQPPPRPVIVLLCATDLVVSRCAEPLLAHQELHPSRSSDVSLHPCTPRSRFHPYRRPEATSRTPSAPLGNPPRSPHPLPRFPSSQACNIHPSSTRAPTPHPDSSSTDSSPLSSPASSPRSLIDEEINSLPLTNDSLTPLAVSTKIKIERPKGAGRKNLLELVNWTEDFLEAVKVRLTVLKASHQPVQLVNRLMPGSLSLDI
jgi:hypothetical protein